MARQRSEFGDVLTREEVRLDSPDPRHLLTPLPLLPFPIPKPLQNSFSGLLFVLVVPLVPFRHDPHSLVDEPCGFIEGRRLPWDALDHGRDSKWGRYSVLACFCWPSMDDHTPRGQTGS